MSKQDNSGVRGLDVLDGKESDEGVVAGLVRLDIDLGDYGKMVDVDPELVGYLAERCQNMGWGSITLYVRDGSLLVAQSKDADDEDDVYVAIAPIVDGVDGE